MKKTNCILIGSGDFFPSQLHITDTDYVIAVDGGFDHLKGMGIFPHQVIGDFDSIAHSKDLESNASYEVTALPVEKDDTDMLAGIRIGLSLGFSTFHIYGGLGGSRFSHSLGNIQCLIFLHKQGKRGFLHDKDSTLTILENETLHFPKGTKGELSLFALDKSVSSITLEGFRYPLHQATLTYDYPLGISNEFAGTPAMIQVGSGMLLSYITNQALDSHFYDSII